MIEIRNIDPSQLKYLPTANPNVMEPHAFESLCKAIKTDGFLQPILVVEEKGDLLIVDGVHRSKAAVAVGLSQIPAVVAPDRNRAEVLRLALNRLRGELDLSEVGRQLSMLIDEGYTPEELTLTGFASWEIDALLDTPTMDDELEGANAAPPQPPKPKTYSLTIKFENESDRAYVKDALIKTGEETPAQQLMELVAHALVSLGE